MQSTRYADGLEFGSLFNKIVLVKSLKCFRLSLKTNLGGWVLSVLPAVLAFAYFVFLAALPVVGSRWLDFPVYWEAGRKAILGVTVYDVPGHFQYKYSPFIALLFGKIFSPFSFETASFIFQKTMLAIWVALFLRFSKRDYRIVLVTILFLGNALRLDLELGQVNAFVLFLLAMLFTILDRPRNLREDVPFGVAFSIAVQLKLFAVIFIPLLIVRREWRKLLLSIFFLPFISLGGVALFHGWDFALSENRAWLASLSESTDALLLSEQNVAALGTFGKLLGLAMGKLLWLATGLGFAAFLWKNRDRPVEWFRDWLLFGIVVFNPLVWSYWILYALPMFASRLPDFEGAFRRRSPSAHFYGGVAATFIFFAFNGQHARWAWNGGIFIALVLMAMAVSKVRTNRASR